MTKVSKRILDENLEKCIFSILLTTIMNIKSQQEALNFLEDILSPTEKTMIIKRLAIAILLSKGYTYDEIDHTLKVSRNTIMGVSNFLKHSQTGGYRKIAQRIISDQKREELFDKVEELLLSISPKKLYGSPDYEKKKKAGKELFMRKLLRSRL